jgi:TctA family transporter
MNSTELYHKLMDEHRRLHFGWARDVIKLSASGLALTVSLQSFFLKPHSQTLWMLAVSWGCLVFAILFGLWALRGEVDLYYTAADSLGFVRSKTTNEQAISQILQNESLAELRPEYKRAYSAMIAFFVAGLLGFVLFGILNLP